MDSQLALEQEDRMVTKELVELEARLERDKSTRTSVRAQLSGGA
eukprot:SAG31_NODE_1819_length_7201_cov_9.661504_3_plen_44_part_00